VDAVLVSIYIRLKFWWLEVIALLLLPHFAFLYFKDLYFEFLSIASDIDSAVL